MAHPLVLKFAPERPPQAMKQANNVKSKMASMMTCIKGTWEAWEAPVFNQSQLTSPRRKGIWW